MWIALCGPTGTSKQKIVEYLKKDFEFEKYEFPIEENLPAFDKILTLLIKHQERQFRIHEDMKDSSILTVRSIWDVSEVFSKVMFKRQEISKEQYNWITKYVSAVTDCLKPPSAIIYMKPVSKMASYNRILMKEGEVDQTLFDLMAEAYEEFMGKLGIPVVEIDHGSYIDEILKQIEYGVSSLKTSALTEDSIWTRRMFK